MAWPPTNHQDVTDEITAMRAAWTDFTPTFTADTTNPTLGNFTLEGRYAQRGKTVTFSIVITANASTGLGSGTYRFGFPVPPRDYAHALVTGVQSAPVHLYQGRGTSASVFALFTAAEVTLTAATSGITTGTQLRINGTYEAA